MIPADVRDDSTTINSQHLVDDVPLMSIQIPPELIQQFTNSTDGKGEGEGVRAIAALYYNVEDLFPNGANKYEFMARYNEWDMAPTVNHFSRDCLLKQYTASAWLFFV